MKKKLIKSYVLPHAPVLIPEVEDNDRSYCAETCNSMKNIAKEIVSLMPKRIVIVSPHGALFSDAISVNYSRKIKGNLEQYGTEKVNIVADNDIPFIDKLSILSAKKGITLAKMDNSLTEVFGLEDSLDYGATVPLYFIQKEYFNKSLSLEKDTEIVCLTYGLLGVDELYSFGISLRECIESSGKETIFIASADLSHCLSQFGPYSFSYYGEIYDQMVLESLKKSDPFSFLTCSDKKREKAQTCSFQSIAILFGLYDKKIFKSKILSYEFPFGVGYLVASLNEMDGISPSVENKLKKWLISKKINIKKLENDYIRLARDTVEFFVKNKKRPFFDRNKYNIPFKSAACFVTLKNESGLRGCIGSAYPLRQDLFQEIIENAISVCDKDDRFEEVDESELSELFISVDVISEPQKVGGILDLNPKKFGIVVETKEKQGVLLPEIEGIRTPSDQLRLALKKAGIDEYEEYTIKRFTVERHEVEH